MNAVHEALYSYLVRLGDTNVVLGQLLCLWCARAPMLEEDIALTNMSLDCFGQASLLLDYACTIEGKGRTADELVYWRGERDYKNYLIAEVPNGDFACTMARQFLIDVFFYHLYDALAASSKDKTLAAIAGKSKKEVAYHLRHSRSWLIRLGDGTEESHRRLSDALDTLAPYCAELYVQHEQDELLVKEEIIVSPDSFEKQCKEMIELTCKEAGVPFPESAYPKFGGPQGIHSEQLGYLLAEMQSLTRQHPGARW